MKLPESPLELEAAVRDKGFLEFAIRHGTALRAVAMIMGESPEKSAACMLAGAVEWFAQLGYSEESFNVVVRETFALLKKHRTQIERTLKGIHAVPGETKNVEPVGGAT